MKTEALARILPPVTEANSPYFEGLDVSELRLQRCTHDGTWRFPESPVCPKCLSEDFEWTAVSGRARLWSWIVMHQVYFEAFADEVPYLVAFVQLAEGPFLMSTVIGADRSELSVDAELELDVISANGIARPAFRLAR